MQRHGPALFLGALCLTVFVSRLLMLWQSPFATGIDGYYYVLQVKNLLQQGSLYLPDSSPVFYLLALPAALGLHPVAAIKLVAALLATLPLVAGYYAASRLSGDTRWGVVTACGLALVVSLPYMAIEFLKSLASVSLLLLLTGLLANMEIRKAGPARIALLVLVLALTVLCHRLSAVVGLMLVACWLLLGHGRRLQRLILLAAGLVASGLLLFLVRGGLHPADVARLRQALTPVPALPLLSPAYRNFLPLLLVVELSVAMLLTWGLGFFPSVRKGRTLRALWLCLLLLFLPFWNMANLDFGFRLFLVGVPLLLPVLAAILAREPSLGTASCLRRPVPIVLATLGIVVLVTSALLPTRAYRPERDPPYALYQRLLPTIKLPPGSTLICHRGFNLFFSAMTGLRGLSYLPDYPVARETLWRLTYFVSKDLLEHYLAQEMAQGQVRALHFPYHLVREDAWQKLLRLLPPDQSSLLTNAMNPHYKKPRFLREQQGF